MLVDWKPDILLSGFCVVVCMLSHGWLFGTPQTVDAMDCSLPDCSVHGIFQARIQEWVYFLLQGISTTQGSNPYLLSLLRWQVDSLPLSHQRSPTLKSEELSLCAVQKKKIKKLHSRKLNTFRRPHFEWNWSSATIMENTKCRHHNR